MLRTSACQSLQLCIGIIEGQAFGGIYKLEALQRQGMLMFSWLLYGQCLDLLLTHGRGSVNTRWRMRNLGCVLLASMLTVGPWLACVFVSPVPPRVVVLGVWPSGGALMFLSLSSLSGTVRTWPFTNQEESSPESSQTGTLILTSSPQNGEKISLFFKSGIPNLQNLMPDDLR